MEDLSSVRHKPFVVVSADKCLDVNTEIENLKNAVVKVYFMLLLRTL